MSKKITDWPNKGMVKCAKCGNVSTDMFSMPPPENTSYDKIHIQVGTRSFSMLCIGCGHYTIYAPTTSAVERLIDKYKSKNP